MFGSKEPFDLGSFVMVVLTFVVFAIALFIKGFTKDILLEIGIPLVSVKILMMSYKISRASDELLKKMEQLCSTERP